MNSHGFGFSKRFAEKQFQHTHICVSWLQDLPLPLYHCINIGHNGRNHRSLYYTGVGLTILLVGA